MRRGWRIWLAIGLALVLAAPVFATESRFFDGAQRWFDRRCERERVSDSIAFDCYLFEQVQLLREREAPALRTFDAKGEELGLVVDVDVVFDPSLNLLVQIEPTGRLGKRTAPYFTTSDCTGTAYASIPGISMPQYVNFLLSAGPGRHYKVPRGIPESPVAYIRRLDWREEFSEFRCEDDMDTRPLRELTAVLLPFSDPVSLPLEYRYE